MRVLDVVGPVRIVFKNRISITMAMVIPSGEPLLGVIPMEDLDVIIHPLTRQLVVNPENPYLAKKKLKQSCRINAKVEHTLRISTFTTGHFFSLKNQHFEMKASFTPTSRVACFSNRCRDSRLFLLYLEISI